MLMAIEDLSFANGVNGSQPSSPSTQASNPSTMSTTRGVTTVARAGSQIVAGMPVVVYADYSCWVPLIQSFVVPESTNIASKLNLGSGS